MAKKITAEELAARDEWMGKYIELCKRFRLEMERWLTELRITSVEVNRNGIGDEALAEIVERRKEARERVAEINTVLYACYYVREQAMAEAAFESKSVLTDRYFYGKSLQDIAGKMGKTTEWVEKTLNEGLAGLIMPEGWEDEAAG